ncbi:MAG: ribonuclease T [Endozoicomonadaceae bacterium]|nr:ribonuclease T [Endozoicomonadaceae bacterium]
MSLPKTHYSISERFRGFLPVVVDVETGGFNSETDALLEISAVLLAMDSQGNLTPDDHLSFLIKPFKGSRVDQAAIDFIGQDPFSPFRLDYSEEKALNDIFTFIRAAIKKYKCNRAILVGHNAAFDLSFVNAGAKRIKAKRNPFHPFSCFDTCSLAGVAYGHTVLARACELAHISFNQEHAHSARYDAEKTAELFCKIVNQWRQLNEGIIANQAIKSNHSS